MSIVKSASYRALDLATIWMLIYGSQGFQTFALWVVGIMTVCVWVTLFFELKPDEARELSVENPVLRLFVIAINFAYVYALIVSGSPVWAAFYCIGMISVKLKAQAVIDRAKKEAA